MTTKAIRFRHWMVMFTVLAMALTVEASEPVPLAGTSWTLDGKAVVVAKGYGGLSAKGPLYVTFGEDNTVELEDDEGYGFSGVYGFDEKGKLYFEFDEAVIEEFIEELVVDLEPELAAYLEDVELTSLVSKAKASERKGVIKLSLSLNFKADVVVDNVFEGKIYTVGMSYKMSAKGNQSVMASEAEGSVWMIEANTKYKASKLKGSHDVLLKLLLGPLSAEGLSASECELYEVEGGEEELLFSGHFTRMGKKIEIIPDSDMMETLITEVTWEELADSQFVDDVLDFEVYDVVPKMTVTIKEGISVKLSAKCVFWSWVETYDDAFDVRGTLTVKGAGTIVE